MFTTNPLYVRIFINTQHPDPTKQNGWALRIPILENIWYLALPIGQAIVTCIRNLLAADTYIQWATLGHAEYPWWQQALITAPLEPLPQWGDSWADVAGLWWDFNNGQGQVQGRLFRAVEGVQFGQDSWKSWPFNLPPGIAPLPADITTATKLQLFANAFTTFRQYFGVLRRHGPRVDGVQTYDLTAVQDVQFVRVSSRRVGGPWCRQSWEALPWTYAPPFSPCGMVTGVGRRSFLVRCKFYPNAPTQIIHYYRAKPTAQVFPLPHIFWGRFTEEDIFNSYGVGELTGNTRRWWNPGYEFGDAPGDHYSGPVAGFTGEYLPDWSPVFPVPLDRLPLCDTTVNKGPLEADGCFCLGGALKQPRKIA